MIFIIKKLIFTKIFQPNFLFTRDHFYFLKKDFCHFLLKKTYNVIKKNFNPLLQKRFLFDFIRKKNIFSKSFFIYFFFFVKKTILYKLVFSNFILKKGFQFYFKKWFFLLLKNGLIKKN